MRRQQIHVAREIKPEKLDPRQVYIIELYDSIKYEAVYERPIRSAGYLYHQFVHNGFGDAEENNTMLRSSIRSGDFTVEGRTITMRKGCMPNVNPHSKFKNKAIYQYLSRVYAEAKR